MDGGLFGGQRSTGNRTGGAGVRREPAPARTASAETAHREEPVVHRTGTTHHSTSTKQPKQAKSLKWVIAAIVVFAVLAGGWFAWQKITADDGIDNSKYQAVFFTNGQVYFGKLAVLSGGQFKLTNVFYVQSQDDTKTEKAEGEVATNQNNMQLIKMGNEVHGPEDAMIINRDQVLFYENLKADGKVAKTIAEYKNSKQ